MRKKINAFRILMGKSEGIKSLESLRTTGRITLRWVFKKRDGRM
jgi:hypothetical protein